MRHSLLVLTVVCAGLVMGGDGRAQTSIGLGAILFVDSGELSSEEHIGPLDDTSREDITNSRLMAGAATFLFDLDGEPAGFRLGGELRYHGEYAAEIGDGDDFERYEIGTIMEVGFRGEWLTELAPKFTIALGLRFDLGILLPGGELADEANRLEGEGVPTSDGPRLGWTIGPMVGARYELHERVHARLDLGLVWTRMNLFDIDETVQGISYVRDDTLTATRFEITLGIELSL